MREVIWKLFDISKYVNYEQDGYKYEGYIEGGYYSWKHGYGHRTWIKACGSYEYQIVETDMQPIVDYMVMYPCEDGVIRVGANHLRHVGRISWERRRDGEKWIKHRDDGPAFIRLNQNEKLSKTEWWIKGNDISQEVRPWLKNMGLPPFYNWKDEHKMLFKLAFA